MADGPKVFLNTKTKAHLNIKFNPILSYDIIKTVVCAGILPQDFLRTLGNYYLSLTIAKIQRLKKFHR